jgi:hypothetical protein
LEILQDLKRNLVGSCFVGCVDFVGKVSFHYYKIGLSPPSYFLFHYRNNTAKTNPPQQKQKQSKNQKFSSIFLLFTGDNIGSGI